MSTKTSIPLLPDAQAQPSLRERGDTLRTGQRVGRHALGLLLLVSLCLPSTGQAQSSLRYFQHTANAAISGHNTRHLSNVSPEDCARACLDARGFSCKSFDYYKNARACDLSDKSAADVGGLNTNYRGNPYDHYALSATPRDDTEEVNVYGEVPDMCWRDSYGRGVGTIPTACAGGRVNEAGLCYTPCRSGYTGAAMLCWIDCPSGFRDDGFFCAKPEPYGRGGGYPWQFGDALNLDAARARCEKDNPQGCEKSGEIMYPKCRSGFHPAGCCICSPNCPSGMNDIGVSCAKPPGYDRGVGIIPTGCPGGENNGGLCYQECRRGFHGVGPVCWGNACPSAFPVECGMGCATSYNACVAGIINQVVSPLEMVANITGMVFTGGSSGVATAAARTGAKTIAKTTIKSQLKQQAKRIGKNLRDDTLDNAAATFYEAQLTGQFSWTDLDPSGIANVVKAYDKPLCKDYR